MPLSSSDPRGSLALADATAFLLSRVGERLQRQAEIFQHSLTTEGLGVTSVLDAGRAIGLAELAAAEAQDLAQVLTQDFVAELAPDA